LWLGLVDLQNELIVSANVKRESMLRLVYEKQMAILDKALKANPKNEILICAYMDKYHDFEE
jgi:hypothetical protein